ncbi:hypothetical protein BGX21_004695 [Mortierella sp. AD011]|nr:hypothetical protein BGX20_011642 [Mortierella sp. AD010]KAF9403384.1 hypothetical protein BGX21_004695 [Mortierella sp. AD011]
MDTNGYELKLLAYSLTKPKSPSHSAPNTTQFKLKSILIELSNSTRINDMFPGDRYVVAGINSGIHNAASATVLDSDKTDGGAINLSISQGSQAYIVKQYMKELNRAKQRKTFIVGNQQKNVNQLEKSITPITCQQAGQDQTGPWEHLLHAFTRLSGPKATFESSMGLTSSR